MDRQVQDILEDLYLIEPRLRAEEENLKKTIEELLASRPDARMDGAFEAELKQRLLDDFAKKGRPGGASPRRTLAFPFLKAGLGLSAAAAVLVALFIGLGPGLQAMREQQAHAAQGLQPSGTVALAPLVDKDSGSAVAANPASPPVAAKAADQKAAGGSPAAIARELSIGQPPAPPSSLPMASRSAAAPGSPSLSGPAAPYAEAEAAGAPKAFDMASAERKKAEAPVQVQDDALANRYNQDFNTEGYDRIVENSFAKATEEPLSTFSIDVDTASYANVRRFLRSGQLPPPDAVRIEELVNYFPYEYAGPSGSEPFGFDLELAPCPWNPGHSLLRVALQAKRIPADRIPPSNLVFLIDVSGSMEEENKLPLVKESLKLLARRMRAQDRISIVVYAGSAGLVLPPTPGSSTDRILKAIDGLESGGSTAGSEGIRLAYEEAKKAYIQGGSNRVILATDGDFNVGPSSDGELVRLIEEERKAGIFLTVLGFGMGNYQDSKMQKLADSGNGNYAYVDSLNEADKVLARQMAGTLFTVAKDVKVQIEFNPALVGEYRLIGYEKRALAARDFADDTKDAGELGAGSSVTVLYELVPPAGSAARGDLRYQSTTITTEGAKAAELLTLKFRYKKPDGSASSLIEKPIVLASKDFAKCSADFRFATAVAEWGLLLRGSAYKGKASIEEVLAIARPAVGADPGGFRAEFLELVEASRRLGR